jgi:hypothetical protein
MKKFVSENWYKLMILSSLLMASFGFMMHSVSPANARTSNDNIELKKTSNSGISFESTSVIYDGVAYFVNGGYMYYISVGDLGGWSKGSGVYANDMKKKKLP